jgi:hypothetical protein
LKAFKVVIVVGAVFGATAVAALGWKLSKHPSAVTASDVNRITRPLDVAELVYDGKFGAGWEDWGWGPHEIKPGEPARISFAGYGGIVMHRGELSGQFGALVFRYKAPAKFGDFLGVTLRHQAKPESAFPSVTVARRHIAKLPDGWNEVLIDFNELNPTYMPFDRILIASKRAVGSDWVLLDKIALTKNTGTSPHAKPALRDARMTIQCNVPARPINPLIYGISLGVWDSGGSANRIGGNPISRLNWDIGNVWNTGADWFFENVRGPDGTIYDWIGDAAKRGVKSAVVIPTIGWVAKDTSSFGFPIAKLGPQQKEDQYRPGAGNGVSPDGKQKIAPGPPTETSVAAAPEVIGRWIRTLREKDAARGSRGVDMYILDNEPSLWNDTHRDVHPEPLGYDELLDRTIRYGTEIRRADPEAVIAGPAEWGWTGYLYSAKDREAGTTLRPDRRAHGDVPLIAWYLRRLAEHERATGTRLLDVLDLHYYPQADGIYAGGGGRTDREGAALRIRSTRSLWDPEYQDESWINERVRLIPRMREWVEQNYPGRKLALGEWSFGGEEHISGALATAESLGRFGVHGLDAAFYWAGPKANSSAFWAFRAYRNYDGKGARFEDWSIPTRTVDGTSLYASRNADGSRVVAVLLNLDADTTVNAKLDATSCGRVRSQRDFSYQAGSQALGEEPKPAVLTSEFPLRLAPYSLRVIELTFDPKQPH